MPRAIPAALIALLAIRAPSVAHAAPSDALGASRDAPRTPLGAAPGDTLPVASYSLIRDAGHFFKSVGQDQAPLWTSPFRLRSRDLRWVAPVGAGLAVLIATDRHTAARSPGYTLTYKVGRDISNAGLPAITIGVASGLYLTGLVTRSSHAREAGLMGAEALVDATLIGEALKLAANRQRPDQGDGTGRFWDGGQSFPSGHTYAAWAVASAMAHEYPRHFLVRAALYGGATLVGAARFASRQHFLSDVVAGSLLGYAVGDFVYRSHHARALSDSTHAGNKHSLVGDGDPATPRAGLILRPWTGAVPGAALGAASGAGPQAGILAEYVF